VSFAAVHRADADTARSLADECGVRVFALAADLGQRDAPDRLVAEAAAKGGVAQSQTATRVIDAGASFVVSPVLKLAIIDVCHRNGVAALPGCFSPTEILIAWESGADIVKVFPATALGPSFFTDVRGPLPQLKLMPTGGVTLDNAGDWIRAGAVAVGVGTALLDRAAIAAGNYDVLRANAARITAGVRAARGTA
jgi:2-dehydro-3-deoxyphosphogluconate aldolase / (4S)-4-hydroxy-2-oxoglutarate aldolase